mmetsp:Transcript_19714/g.59792  ORF Transcript_19714/g.59792 Transcript_19714/m.59792 type:complete len:225 (+) Transcript_19714:353-1027(+)
MNKQSSSYLASSRTTPRRPTAPCCLHRSQSSSMRSGSSSPKRQRLMVDWAALQWLRQKRRREPPSTPPSTPTGARSFCSLPLRRVRACARARTAPPSPRASVKPLATSAAARRRPLQPLPLRRAAPASHAARRRRRCSSRASCLVGGQAMERPRRPRMATPRKPERGARGPGSVESSPADGWRRASSSGRRLRSRRTTANRAGAAHRVGGSASLRLWCQRRRRR